MSLMGGVDDVSDGNSNFLNRCYLIALPGIREEICIYFGA